MDRIQFAVNGQKYSVGGEVTSHTMLLDYLRKDLELRGTKYMCREGGCGACIVTAARKPGAKPQAVNSCLVCITSCQDWEVTTIEGVGNRLSGYSEIQKTLAEYNGTQCGYCSPAWVMTMDSLLKTKKPEELTKLEVEKYFSGNICRCTGYRPILDAFKTFAKKDPDDLTDIEDLKICNKDGENCSKNNCPDKEWCFVSEDDIKDGINKEITLKDDKIWYSVTTVDGIFDVFSKHSDESYMLVGGNTAKGAYHIFDYPKILIDISNVEELKGYITDQNLILGSGNTLTETIDIFKDVSKGDDFAYCLKLKEHIELVAHTAVRNIGTIGGNLMIKHYHHDFPSDLFLLFETVGAMLTIATGKGAHQTIDMKKLLTIDMTKKVIINVVLPPFGKNYKLVTYKIMPRAQNAIAIINAGFLYKYDENSDTVSKATIVYGSLNPEFIHAEKTENYLIGKKLNTNETLQGALKSLDQELVAKADSEEIESAKKKIALGLFYKGLLTLYSDGLNARYASGAINLNMTRPVSKGKQVFDTNPSFYPVTEAINKVEALIQCAGEAMYVEDAPKMPHEVYAAFVLSTIGKGEIDSIDAKPALDTKGVVAFYTFKDFPGENTFTPLTINYFQTIEEELTSGKIKFFSEPIGIIVAESEHLADMAAKIVKIKYKNEEPPVIDVKEAKEDLDRVTLFLHIPAIDRGIDVMKVIKGTNYIASQYHFHMEKQVTVTKPTDDGFLVNSSAQFIDHVQAAVATALNISDHSVTVSLKRSGGGFGAKLTRAAKIAVANTLVSYKLNRPSRMILPLTTNTRAVGLRPPCLDDFEVGVNDTGEIQYVTFNVYSDIGYIKNELLLGPGLLDVGGNYKKTRWDFTSYFVTTDRVKSTWMRAPGSLEISAMTEYILERISYELSVDPIDVRINNLAIDDGGESAKEIIEKIKKDAEYDKRKASVADYNKQNRWKKRGLRFALFKWTTRNIAYHSVNVSIYHDDGSVIITHGGVEIGQGINTKAIQVCAYTLNIPVDKIKVKTFSTITSANSAGSAESYTSELVCLGVIKCCETLLERLAPLKLTLGDVAWEDLIKAAYKLKIYLCADHNVEPVEQIVYDIFGTAIAEVEVDVLTGEMQVLRVDLLEDAGQSISPDIDVGQIEGAFVISMGYWTCEDIMYDKATGKLITDRTWNYHVPQALDIPQDMRIYFRKHEYNKKGVLGSKATGEPPMCLGISVPFAIREAISSSREDSGVPSTEWFDIDGAHTTTRIVIAADTRLEEFLFN